MAEFHDDLYDDQPTDTELVRSLRHQLREKDKAVKALTAKVETYEKKDRASTLASILESKGVKPKVAGLLPADLEATPEAVEAWLGEYADVFNIERAESEGEDGENATEGAEGASGTGGLTPEERAAFAALQRTEGGAQTPPLGNDRIRQELADIRSLPSEEAFAKLREKGLMGG